MTSQTKVTWIWGALILTPLVACLLFLIAGPQTITIGHTEMDTRLLTLFIGFPLLKLALAVTQILFTIQGFRVHWGWGVANLFLPPVIIAFCILHPRAARVPLIALGCAFVWLLMLFIPLIFSKG